MTRKHFNKKYWGKWPLYTTKVQLSQQKIYRILKNKSLFLKRNQKETEMIW